MGSWNSSFDDKKKDLLVVISEFLNTSSAKDIRQMLEQHPELLSEEVDSILESYSNNIHSKEIIDTIYGRRNLLAHCREIGITKAFEEISRYSNETSGEDLQMVLEDISSLSRPQDMLRKIILLHRALSLIQLQSNPKLWAALHVNLGISLLQNPQGNRGDNIEEAIEHYNEALKVYTRKDFPVDWAGTQNNLGNAYRSRIRGDKAENIEKAIEHYQNTLEVRTQKDLPVDWAMTLSNLGFAYSKRIRKDRAENIEKAIELLTMAIKEIMHGDLPVQWAEIQNNLGSAYLDRTWGDRVENIEKAIEHCQNALEVRTQTDLPKDWAMTQNNLGLAYSDRIRGNRIENIEKAIEHYQNALEVRTQTDLPEDWAKTQNNLGNAYFNRIRGDRAENIEKAIEHHNQALKVRMKRDLPVDWAMTQNNLGNAYFDRIQEDKAENIEKAIEHYNQALKVRTKRDLPVDWAMTQNNLGNAYRSRIRGDRAENIEKAIEHCQNALQIYKLGSMPYDYGRICRLLGDIYLDISQWEDAVKSYKEAIRASDLLYRSGLSAESKTVEVGENANIYRNAALAVSHLGLAKESLLFLEKGKTRLLNEALRLKMKKPLDVKDEEWLKYGQAAEKYRNATRSSDNKKDYAQNEKEVQGALEELDAAVKTIQRYNPKFQKELEISDILSILDRETALLAFCITSKSSIGFVISRSIGVKSVGIPSFKNKDLNSLLFKSNEQEYMTGGWVGDYLNYVNALITLSDFKRRYEKNGTLEAKNQLSEEHKRYTDAFQAWQKTTNDILYSIGTKLLYPLLEELPPQIKKLILLPSGGLFLLPLHAIPLSDKQILCQRYCISYAPSIQLHKEMRNKAKTVKGEGLYEIINPEKDPALVFSGYEGQAIYKLFQSRQKNVGKDGTKQNVLANVLGRAYIHFSCHGNYNWSDPTQSGLYLTEKQTLSLADLQSDIVDMSSARLVTLSACETGITDIVKGSADEFVGLPSGFMLAGVPCVVSSLWSVPDISTAILMERFYSNHIVGGMDIPIALQDAQLWVRDLTYEQLMKCMRNVEECYKSDNCEGKSIEFNEQYMFCLKNAKESPDAKPFKHPYYWAAFTVNGA